MVMENGRRGWTESDFFYLGLEQKLFVEKIMI